MHGLKSGLQLLPGGDVEYGSDCSYDGKLFLPSCALYLVSSVRVAAIMTVVAVREPTGTEIW